MSEDQISKKSSPWKKIGLMLAFIVSGILIVSLTPVGAYLSDVKLVRDNIEQAGIWGFLIFIAVFLISGLLSIPGTGFLILACIIYDEIWIGAMLSYVAAMITAIATFYVGRSMGGGALSGIKNVRVRRLIASAENNPIRSIALLRTILMLSPLIGFTLALTKMRPRDYIIGNLIGIIIPITYLSIAMFFVRNDIMRFFGIDL